MTFAIVLVFAILILPVFAAERTVFTCPTCKRGQNESWVVYSESEEPVVTCSKYPFSHMHVHKSFVTKVYCDYCDVVFVAEVDSTVTCVTGITRNLLLIN